MKHTFQNGGKAEVKDDILGREICSNVRKNVRMDNEASEKGFTELAKRQNHTE